MHYNIVCMHAHFSCQIAWLSLLLLRPQALSSKRFPAIKVTGNANIIFSGVIVVLAFKSTITFCFILWLIVVMNNSIKD